MWIYNINIIALPTQSVIHRVIKKPCKNEFRVTVMIYSYITTWTECCHLGD